MHRILRAYWPVVAWMFIIFLFSTNLGAASHTSRFLGPLLRWLDPSISAAGIEQVQFLVRKGAHMFEYALLGILILRAMRVWNGHSIVRWSWPTALAAWGGSTAYAATDEFHQYFVATRTASAGDVLVDAIGAALGVTLAFLWSRRRSKAVATDCGAM